MNNNLNYTKKDYIYIFVFFLLLVLIIVQIGSRLLNSHLDYDEGYNLQISQNLHNRGEYATYDKLLDPYITTGPTVLLPASLFINSSYPLSPRLISAIYAFVLIGVSYRYIMKSKLQKIFYLLFLNIIPLFFFFSTHVLGELPAFTFFILALLMLKGRYYLLAGVLCGLAILTKTMFILSVIPLGGIFLYEYLEQKKLSHLFYSVFKFILGFICVFIVWNIFVFWQLDFDYEKYLYSLNESYKTYKMKSSSSPGLIHGRLEMITWVFVLDAKIIILGIFSLIGLVFLRYKRSNSLIISAAIFGMVMAMYFLVFGSTNWYRHFLPTILCLSILVPYFAGEIIDKYKKSAVLALFMIGILFTFLAGYTKSSDRYKKFQYTQRLQQNLIFEYEGFAPQWKPDALLISQFKMKRFMTAKISQTKKISGTGWWNAPELSYLAERKIERNPFAKDINYIVFHIYGDLLAPDKIKKLDNLKGQTVAEEYGYKIVLKD